MLAPSYRSLGPWLLVAGKEPNSRPSSGQVGKRMRPMTRERHTAKGLAHPCESISSGMSLATTVTLNATSESVAAKYATVNPMTPAPSTTRSRCFWGVSTMLAMLDDSVETRASSRRNGDDEELAIVANRWGMHG